MSIDLGRPSTSVDFPKPPEISVNFEDIESNSEDERRCVIDKKLVYIIFMIFIVIFCFFSGLILVLTINNRAMDPLSMALLYHGRNRFIDGRNLLPFAIRKLIKNSYYNLDELNAIIDPIMKSFNRKLIGGVVWSTWIDYGYSGNKSEAEVALQQTNIIYDIILKYRDKFEMITNISQLENVLKTNKIISVINIGCINQFNIDFSELKVFRLLGAVSISLKSGIDYRINRKGRLDIADSNNVEITPQIIYNINEAGVMIDLAFADEPLMRKVLSNTRKPVVFTLSGAKSLCNSDLNIPDSLFSEIVSTGSIVMVPLFAPCICDSASLIFKSMEKNEKTDYVCTIKDYVSHITYFIEKLGIDHVGIATNFDHGLLFPIEGVQSVADVVLVTAELIVNNYTEDQIAKIIGKNFLSTWANVSSGF